MDRRWVIEEQPAEQVASLSRALGVSPITAHVLLNRGEADADSARDFLRPVLGMLTDPMQVPALREAAERLSRAVREGRKITVYGDYDVDGMAATCILVRCLRGAGGDVDYYVPLRDSEGYGLNADALEDIRRAGSEVVVTVDCGTTAFEEARRAAELGLELIVTDHHEPEESLPEAAVVCNPKWRDSGFAFRELSGAGVAFKLAWALARVLSGEEKVTAEFRDFLVSAVSLVSLGTVADVVPLRGENRVFAHYGLRALAECEDPGLRALLDVTRLTGRTLSSYDIGFKVAPRLNAAGRMGDARRGIDLLLAERYEDARAIAEDLDRVNTARRKVQDEMLAEAEAALEETFEAERDHFIVLSSDRWRRGVVGIVASKIAERYWRPTVLLAAEDDVAHGSGRSVGRFNLLEALSECRDVLLTLGGHARAAGLSVAVERIAEFRERVNGVTAAQWAEDDRAPSMRVDREAALEELTEPVVRELGKLAPFGEANPRPVLASRGVRVVGSPQIMGSRQQHLDFLVRHGDATLRAVWFGAARRLDEIHAGLSATMDVAYEPRINDYRGRVEVELRVRDVKLPGPADAGIRQA
jgi:single-stranded-DNA-specific exonuclease